MGFQRTKSCKLVTRKLTTHLQFFYVKDPTRLDNENNMYLGPVVAAQQVLNSSSQTSHPQKEKKEGSGTSTTAKSLGVSTCWSKYRSTSSGCLVMSFIFI